jgi:hypothetical protein
MGIIVHDDTYRSVMGHLQQLFSIHAHSNGWRHSSDCDQSVSLAAK